MKDKPTVIDLFCGAGGLAWGFKKAGFDVLFGIDIDRWCCLTFAYNFDSEKIRKEIDKLDFRKTKSWLNKQKIEYSKVKIRDLKNVEEGEISKWTKGRKVDVVVGGPPCQGFSMAGRRDPNDPRNSLFMDFLRLVNILKPEWVVMENVVGILSMKTANGEMVKNIIEDEFEKIGYLVDVDMLNSADYGVPQRRRRVFFIGTNTGKEIEFPIQTHAKDPKKTMEKLGLKKWFIKRPIRKWVPVRRVLFKESEVDKKYFHTQRMIDGFVKRKQRNIENGRGFGWQILKMNKPSYTISARYWKDGSDALIRYSPTKVRMLTERECARIQSFPDDFKFIGPEREVYKQIGNAVPALLAKSIGEKIKASL